MKRLRSNDRGITLIELMVVVTILAIVLILAVPAFTRDRLDAEFAKFVRTFAHDVRRAHQAALSSRDHRQILMSRDRYQIRSVTAATGGGIPTLELTRTAPPDVVISGVTAQTAEPGMSYTTPSGAMSGQRELRLEATGGLSVETSAGSGSFASSSATIFFQTLRGGYRARIVIYQATCHAKLYDQW